MSSARWFEGVVMVELLLADAETVRNWLAGIAIVVSAVVAVGLFVLRNRQEEMQRKARLMEGLEDKLHDANVKLIDERFRAMTHDLNGHVGRFSSTLDLLTVRLKDGEAHFDKLGERDQRTELGVAAKVDQLKDLIRETCASKEDLGKHEERVETRFRSFEHEMGELGKSVAVLNDRVGKRDC